MILNGLIKFLYSEKNNDTSRKSLPKKSFEFDLNRNQSAIDAYPRLKDKAYNLLETEKIQSLYHLLENKDNWTAKGIGDWLRKF